MDYPKIERHRSSFDSKAESPRIPHRMSFDAASSLKYSNAADQLRSSFDARDLSRSSLEIKEALRGSLQRERSRSSVDCRDSSLLRESPRFGSGPRQTDPPRLSVDGKDGRVELPMKALIDSPRLSVRLKEAVRAAVEGRLDPVRSSFDSKEALRNASSKSSSFDLKESVRSGSNNRSRDNRLLVELQESPRLSRDAPRYSFDGRDGVRSSNDTFRDSLRGVAQKARESPRLSVDGCGPRRLPIDDSARSEMEGKVATSNGEPRRSVPSVVARLMGLEDLPDGKPPPQQIVLPHQITVPQQIPGLPKKPSKESKLLKGLLQYNPRTDTKSLNEPREGDEPNQDQLTLKHVYTPRPHTDNVTAQPGVWNGIHESPRQLRQSSPKHLAIETMPLAFKQQDIREIGALGQKVTQAMPKQLTEAVLTVLKNSDEGRRMPMSYADMENRLRQLRLRSTLQDHKTLRQILEAMQSKGLLSGASRPKEISLEHDMRHQEERLEEPKRLGSRFHEQVFGPLSEDIVKSARPQQVAVSKPTSRSPDEQQSASGASIVVMKPIGKPVKKSRSQNPALLVEAMPSARSPKRARESGRSTSPWSSPVSRSARSPPGGYGFGRETTGRFSAEDSAAARRERILARSVARDVQSEPTMMPKSPKLIALPQSTAKFRSSSATREAPEGLRSVKGISSTGNKAGESGRKARPPSKEENSKPVSTILFLKSQSGRDFVGLKKPVPEADQKDEKIRRRSAESKLSTSVDKEASKSTGPGEVTTVRSRTSTGKRITLPEPEVRTPTAKRAVGNGGGADEKTKERSSALSQGNPAPPTPRSLLKNSGNHTKKDELNGRVGHVRETNGDATDQSSGRSPLVGLTNRLQSPEVGSGELDRDGQGVRTPRAGIVAKKIFSSQEEQNLLGDTVKIAAEQPAPNPVSDFDGDVIGDEDVAMVALDKTEDGLQGDCDGKADSDIHMVWPVDTPPQECRDVAVANDLTPVKDTTQQAMFLRESAKILPPQGQVKPIILPSQAEKAYVRDILVVSGATMGMKTPKTSGCIIDSTVFDYLEERQGSTEYVLEQTREDEQDAKKFDGEKVRQISDRRMLFDCVNDVLATLLVPYVNSEPWIQGLHVQPLRKRPMGQTLVQQLWDEIQSLPPQKSCEDICDSLYTVLQKDLMQSRNSWSDFSFEFGDIGLEVEKMLFNDLVDEMLFDLAQSRQIEGLYVQ